LYKKSGEKEEGYVMYFILFSKQIYKDIVFISLQKRKRLKREKALF
jgi:hypothetical protein